MAVLLEDLNEGRHVSGSHERVSIEIHHVGGVTHDEVRFSVSIHGPQLGHATSVSERVRSGSEVEIGVEVRGLAGRVRQVRKGLALQYRDSGSKPLDQPVVGLLDVEDTDIWVLDQAASICSKEVGRLGEYSPRKAAPSVVEHLSAGFQSYQSISEVVVDVCQAPRFIVRSIA